MEDDSMIINLDLLKSSTSYIQSLLDKPIKVYQSQLDSMKAAKEKNAKGTTKHEDIEKIIDGIERVIVQLKERKAKCPMTQEFVGKLIAIHEVKLHQKRLQKEIATEAIPSHDPQLQIAVSTVDTYEKELTTIHRNRINELDKITPKISQILDDGIVNNDYKEYLLAFNSFTKYMIEIYPDSFLYGIELFQLLGNVDEDMAKALFDVICSKYPDPDKNMFSEYSGASE